VNKLLLSVVIPCFEEMANLQKGVLDKVNHYLLKRKEAFEVIIVDDGSKDGSVAFIEQFIKENKNFRLIKNAHTGKAGAVTTGMLAAVGELVLFTDMDQATPIEEIEKLMPYFQKKFDIVIGSRSTARKGSPFIRLFISRANIVLRKLIVGIPGISDTQCGFKMFRREVAQDLFSKINSIHNNFKSISGSSVSSGFDVELLYIAEKSGYKIREVSVQWLYVETRRVNPIKDSVDGVMELLRIKQNAVSGKYNV
jgi:glycosyltransferase involved in cell wall biosynthesis